LFAPVLNYFCFSELLRETEIARSWGVARETGRMMKTEREMGKEM
jgi:hypothetical protein